MFLGPRVPGQLLRSPLHRSPTVFPSGYWNHDLGCWEQVLTDATDEPDTQAPRQRWSWSSVPTLGAGWAQESQSLLDSRAPRVVLMLSGVGKFPRGSLSEWLDSQEWH